MNLFSRKLLTTTYNTIASFYINAHNDVELCLDAYYQRDYVWKEKEQQEFLFSFFNNLPLGTVAIAINSDYGDEESVSSYYEVVDGKQRITTMLMFINNEIPYIVDGVPYYWKDLDVKTQRAFKGRTFPYQEISNSVDEKVKLEYFYRVNFTGVPQDKSHELRILELLEGK